ncbi:MAG: hypothetical protein RLZZ347_642 [Candidatus Parcubacteria bacterium]|jgi:magnesium chelatase family protein
MSFSKVYSAQSTLLTPHIIDIETDLSKGLNAFVIVGLPNKAVEEAKDRISAAIKNAGFTSPKQKNQKVVVSLAPADLKKEGPIFDVGIALGYLLASEEIVFDPEKKLFLGELSLDGLIRGIAGTLPLVEEARKRGFTEVYVPKANAEEAGLIHGISIFAVDTLTDLVHHLDTKTKDEKALSGKSARKTLTPIPQTNIVSYSKTELIDFSDIKGQEQAKRGLEIAAAGGHNIALYGPPGTGKTMLAKAFTGILPPLTHEEMLEVTGIHSVASTLDGAIVTHAPFRSPHHTASYVSLVGGGATPKPGEITLAHRGVLFLDEFPEFDRKVIDALREPLEERVVTVSRAKGSARFPARFILVAALNPCPCGFFGVKGKACTCNPQAVARYRQKVSGPIVDRIDLWVEVSQVEYEHLAEKGKGGESDAIRARVMCARTKQAERFKKAKREVKINSDMSARDLVESITLAPKVKDLLTTSAKALGLSARAYHRVIKLARTIADLENNETIEANHVLEALQYRPKRKEYEL